MSEIAGLKTNTTHTIGGNVKGMGAQVLGFKPGTQNSEPVVDENGFPLASAQKPGYWSNAMFTGLDNAPHAVPQAGFQSFRGMNTITSGGTGGPNNTFQRFNPKNWSRYSSEKIFQPDLSKSAKDAEKSIGKTISNRFKGVDGETISDFWKKDKPGYSPFQLTDQVNSIGRKMLEGADGNFTSKIWKGADAKRARIAEEFGGATIRSGKEGTEALTQVQQKATRATSWLEKKGVLARNEAGKVEDLFGRGTMSHISGSYKIAGTKGPIGEKMAANVNKAYRAASGSEASVVSGQMMGREAGMEYMMGSAKGTVGSRVNGYLAGTMGKEAEHMGENAIAKKAAGSATKHLGEIGLERVAGRTVVKEAGTLGLEAGAKVGMRGIVKAGITKGAEVGAMQGAKMAGLGIAAGALAEGGWAIPVVNVALAAWMVYDLAKLGTNLAKEMVIKPVTNFVKDGFKSYKGQLDKAPMGMGFKDNSVAMTARQRGVMAISNSRLNARSVLGNEAAGMSAHFG